MLFDLALIFIVGIVLGNIFEHFKLPKLLGYMLGGMLIGVSGFNILSDTTNMISADLRQIALVIILTRAGLTLNLDNLKKVGLSAVLMSFVPASFEILGVVLLGSILLDINIKDALIIGATIAAVSPAVIVPRMIKMINEGYGKKHHLPELVLAGASVDDVFVIVLFTSLVNNYQLNSFDIFSIIKAPLSIVLGVLLGILLSYLINYVYTHVKLNDIMKFLMFISLSFCLLKIEYVLEKYVVVSGLIAIMTSAIFLARTNQKDSASLINIYNNLWSVFEIILFSLLGAMVDLKYAMYAGFGIVLLILGALIFRMFGVLISTFNMKLNKKENIFIMFSYIPKATVQAAISSIPLTMGLECGQLVLTCGVVSILITAPLGAILIDRTYQKLLDH